MCLECAEEVEAEREERNGKQCRQCGRRMKRKHFSRWQWEKADADEVGRMRTRPEEEEDIGKNMYNLKREDNTI